MPIRHYLTLFAMAVVICAGLLGLTFEDRLRGSDDPEAIVTDVSLSTNTLAGVWDTSYGPMTIVVNSASMDDRVEQVSGSWQQGGNTGIVTSGTFDRQSGIFLFKFSEPWHQKTGSAKFVLGEDGVFTGTWAFTGTNGGSSWSMQRPGKNAPSMNVQDPFDCLPAPPTNAVSIPGGFTR